MFKISKFELEKEYSNLFEGKNLEEAIQFVYDP